MDGEEELYSASLNSGLAVLFVTSFLQQDNLMLGLKKRKINRTRTGTNFKTRRALIVEGLEERRLMATFQVLNNNDDGAGSLRAAIVNSNTTTGKDTIEFAISGADKKIGLLTVLPGLTDPVVIDATTQPGFVDRPLVQIDGAAILTNASSGLFILAGDSTVRGLSITNFGTGIFVENLGGNKFEGNYLGLSPSGAANGNRANGIFLNSPGNTVGGSTASQRNVLSGNGESGIRVQGAVATNNLIQGNFIGTDFTGLNSRPNLLDGILVDSASGTIIGTDGNGTGDSSESNLISGNTGRGIRIFKASGNAIAGNLIGVALGGQLALPNGGKGITIDGGSVNNRIGTNGDSTSDDLEKNIISGNSGGGVELFDANSSVIAGNYIGTSADGIQLLHNAGIGLRLSNSSNNRIGTNADGVSDVQERNLISGSETNAIQLEGSDSNVIAGNWLGLSSDGSTSIPNGHSGMWILAGSSENLIGTNDDGVRDEVERNVISGNRLQGIAIDGTYDTSTSKTEKNIVAGNYIGTDITGTQPIPNETGVYILKGATSNIIGTTATSRNGSSAANVISGNQFNGVLIRYAGTSGNQVAGNIIGLSADGLQPLGNNLAGITIAEGPTGNFVGGVASVQANLIAANKSQGIWIVDSSASNFVDGNFVGLASDRVTPMGNGANGVLIQNSGQNRIGTLAGNTIAYNSQAGIAVTLNTSVSNDLSKNVLIGNMGLTIDLGNDGPTSNDLNDADVGPNQLQNYPTLVSAATTGSKTQIAGSLSSAANSTYRIEYFAKTGPGDSIDSMQYLGSGNVQTDRTGQVNWVIELNTGAALDRSIFATATNVQTGTSELSATIPVQNLLPLTIALTSVRENVGTVNATLSRGTQPIGTPLTVSLSSGTPSLAQVPATVQIPAGQSSVTFDITIVNDTVWKVNPTAVITASLSNIAVGSASMSITDDDSPWHNFVKAADVSGEGAVSPRDALLVINILNSGKGKSIYVLAQPTDGSKLFADVNNDEGISPIDALLVINQLNNRASAEGEAVQAADTYRTQPIESMFDLALQDWDLTKRRKS